MKKVIIFLGALLVFLSGCSASDNKKDNKINIMTTVFPIYDFAKNICGDMANVTLLLPPESDSHSFEPTPTDIINISKADAFIYIGLENEAWVKDILSSIDFPENKQLALGGKGEKDEHIWTSLKNASLMCNEIKNKLCEIDPDNSEIYVSNFNEYNKILTELDEKFKDVVDNSKRKTIVFGDRFPFFHFVTEYGLDYYSAFPGCAHETEPSAVTVSKLIDKIKAEEIPVVFHIELSDESITDVLCQNTGAKKMLFHSCHNVTKEELENGVSYFDLMNKNADNLKEALN